MIAAARLPLLVVGLVAVVASCSSGDGTDLDARTPASSSVPSSADVVTPTSVVTPSAAPGNVPATATAPPGSVDDGAVATTASVATVPETGVPGLDAEDAFCAAWSRFGGSFQVIAVNAAFGDGPSEVLEVAAATTVADAYDDLRSNWPDEIADERDAALDGALGPFARRLATASDELAAAGAGDAELVSLDAAWVGALAARDPEDPVLPLDLDPTLRALVDTAAAAYLDEVGSWATDESLVSEVEIPATNDYLAGNCPDQGTLAGQEVGG